MSYIQNKNHLQNIINKVIRDNFDIINLDKILNLDMYYELHHLGILDNYTWEIKNNPTLLHEDNYFNWRKENTISPGLDSHFTDKKLTKDFLDKASDILLLPGIYSFYNESEICLYLGVSIQLGKRIITSFRERFINYKKKIYLRYLITKSCSDAHVLESVAIAILKPVFNTTGKYDDELTIDIKLPEFSYKILCNEEVIND